MMAGIVPARERLYSLPAARGKVARRSLPKRPLNGGSGREPPLNRAANLWTQCNTMKKQAARVDSILGAGRGNAYRR
jgi:hypothetical protein